MKKVYFKCLLCLGVSSVLLFVFNCFYSLIMEKVIHMKMQQMLALGPSSYSYNYWHTPPVPIHFQLFVFDIVNPDEVRQGLPPTVLERGPYTYRVTLGKFNVTFNTNNTVTYRQRLVFVFDRDMSVGSDNDTFCTINTPLFTVGALMRYQYSWLQEAINLLLEGLDEEPLIRVSVHDIFWGYHDPFLQLAKDVLDKLHIKSKIITGTFGFFMGRNNTDDGLYTVHTGADDLSKFLIIDRWNGIKLMDYYSTDAANMINGTDGSLYPPFVTTDRNLQMYDSYLIRSMDMAYSEDSSVRNLPTMKFVVEDKEFANASVNPANAGFCTPLNNCMPSGVLNCSGMGHGAPIYSSLPHFLGGDPYYFSMVRGLQPNRQLHQPFFHLHQLTGVCLSAGRKYQLNVQMKEYSFLSKTKGLSLAYVPVLWINGLAEIDAAIGSMFQDMIQTPLAVANIAHLALYGVTPAIALLAFGLAYRHQRRAKKQTARKDFTSTTEIDER